MKYPVPSKQLFGCDPPSSISGTDAGFGYVDTPIRYQDARTYGSEAKAQLVRSLSYLFQHDARFPWLEWDGKEFWKGKVNKFNPNACFQVVVVLVVSSRERIQILAQAYYAKLLVLPWNQSWDYSFESLPMLTVLEDSTGTEACGLS